MCRFPPTAYYAGFSGIISIGVGDTMASVAGLRYGRRQWPNTKKTLEGTAAGIGASVLVSAVLYLWCPASLALTPAQVRVRMRARHQQKPGKLRSLTVSLRACLQSGR